MSLFDAFLASRLKSLDSEKWDRFVRALAAEIASLQERAGVQDRAADAIVARGLLLIDDYIAPAIADAEAKAAQAGAAKTQAEVLRDAIAEILAGIGASPVSAALVNETADRKFVTTTTRGEIRDAALSAVRGDVDPAYDTLAEIVALIGTKATPADITAAIDGLKGGVSSAYDTLIEIAAKLTDDDTAIAGLLASVANRLRLDAAGSYSAAQKAQGLANLGIADSSRGLFVKADPYSVAFVRTGNGTIALKAGTVIELNGVIYTFSSQTAVQMPSHTGGTDYAIYLCNDGTLRGDVSFTAATGFTTAQCRQMGGYHYAPGGNATGFSTGGNYTNQINPYSIWDIKFRPSALDPRGKAKIGSLNCWGNIYFLGVNHHIDGTSRYGVTIADGASPPKKPTLFGGNGTATYSGFSWFDAAEVLAAYGERFPTQTEFAAAAFGVLEGYSLTIDPVTTGVQASFTSIFGLHQATGHMFTWGAGNGGGNADYGWVDVGRGSTYGQENVPRFGGAWDIGAPSGSRCVSWTNQPTISAVVNGARGFCDHLCLL